MVFKDLVISELSDKAIINDYSRSILENTYCSKKEQTAEDVFRRVAVVCSIPDVVDYIAQKAPGHAQRKGKPKREWSISGYFAGYTKLVKRVFKRRGLDYKDFTCRRISKKNVHNHWIACAKNYYDLMCKTNMMPASPTLANAGTTGMLSSCFFMRIEDSLGHIFEILKKAALVLKAGGGVGFDFSNIRPQGFEVVGTNGQSTGPVSYMNIYDMMGKQINQGGIRQAAMIATLNIYHPDILKFVTCKKKEGVLKNFNISVMVPDMFIEKLHTAPDDKFMAFFQLQNDIHAKTFYYIDKDTNDWVPVNSECENAYTVAEIWEAITDHAWGNGEPGVIFEDTLNKGDATGGVFGKLGVNPCGELPLINFESCNLAALNLSTCVLDNKTVNIEKIASVTKTAIRFLDNVVDLNDYPLPEIENTTLKTRKIGLGVVGLHDLFLKLGVAYGSKKSLKVIDSVFSTIRDNAKEQTRALAVTRGRAPVKLKKTKHSSVRNAGLLTIQPTGTVSLICNQASSAIEPVFKWDYNRKDTSGLHRIEHFIHKQFGDKIPEYAKTTTELSHHEHLAVQSRIQRYIDGSISKTINAANDTTKDQVRQTFLEAHKMKLKSITLYRSGSRNEEVLMSSKKEQKTTVPVATEPRKRPKILFGATISRMTPGGRVFVTINEDKYGTREVFIHTHKAGSEVGTHVETEGRLISNSLKHNVPIDTVVQHLKDHKSTPVFDRGEIIKSVPDAVALSILEYLENFEGFSYYLEENDDVPSVYEKEDKSIQERTSTECTGSLCPECGNPLYNISGCEECHTCSYSRCG